MVDSWPAGDLIIKVVLFVVQAILLPMILPCLDYVIKRGMLGIFLVLRVSTLGHLMQMLDWVLGMLSCVVEIKLGQPKKNNCLVIYNLSKK